MQPGMDQLGGDGQGFRPEVRSIQEAPTPAMGFHQQGLQQAAGHTAEGDTGGGTPGGGTALQHRQGAGIGATRQLQGARGSPWMQARQQPHGGMGGAAAHITAHRPAVELPEGPEPGGAQRGKAMPELRCQDVDALRRGSGMLPGGPFETAADRDAMQGDTGCAQLKHPLAEGLPPPDAGVDLHGVRPQLPQQWGHGFSGEHMLPFHDPTMGAGRQAATTAIAAFLEHSCTRWNRQGRADAFTGPRAVGRAVRRVEPGLAEMGIGAIAEADHQPGSHGSTPIKRPVDAAAGGLDDGRIGGHIQAMHSSQGEQTGQILKGFEVLIAGSADHLHPAAPGKGPLSRGC